MSGCPGRRPTPTSRQVSGGDRHLRISTRSGTTSGLGVRVGRSRGVHAMGWFFREGRGRVFGLGAMVACPPVDTAGPGSASLGEDRLCARATQPGRHSARGIHKRHSPANTTPRKHQTGIPVHVPGSRHVRGAVHAIGGQPRTLGKVSLTRVRRVWLSRRWTWSRLRWSRISHSRPAAFTMPA